jgi:hypothetical protein
MLVQAVVIPGSGTLSWTVLGDDVEGKRAACPQLAVVGMGHDGEHGSRAAACAHAGTLLPSAAGTLRRQRPSWSITVAGAGSGVMAVPVMA